MALSQLFSFHPFHPHLTRAVLCSNEWFSKVEFEDQRYLSWPNYSACQFSYKSDNVNSNFNDKNLQVGGKRKKSKKLIGATEKWLSCRPSSERSVVLGHPWSVLLPVVNKTILTPKLTKKNSGKTKNLVYFSCG